MKIHGNYKATRRFEKTFGFRLEGAGSTDVILLIERLRQEEQDTRIAVYKKLKSVDVEPDQDYQPGSPPKYKLDYVVGVKQNRI